MTQVVLVEDGIVVQAWRDVSSLAEMLAKYGDVAGCVEVPDEVAPGWVWDGSGFAPPPAAVDYPAALRALRDHAIASGSVTVGNTPILTDDLTQQRLTAAALAVTLDPTVTIRWKCADGCFRVLSSAQVIAAAQAVHAYVQACYDREADLLAALDAGDPVDIEMGWP